MSGWEFSMFLGGFKDYKGYGGRNIQKWCFKQNIVLFLYRQHNARMAYTWEQLIREEILTYSLKDYNFRAVFQKIFEYEDLENIHLSNTTSIEGALDFRDDQSTYYHKKFYNSPHLKEFEALYIKFVKVRGENIPDNSSVINIDIIAHT